MSVVLDSSAIIALLRGEPGAGRVQAVVAGAKVSAVNLAEVVSKLVERGSGESDAQVFVETAPFEVVPFDAAQALAAGLLRRVTRAAGLSLGDRACLALAASLGLPALTSDRAWSGLDIGVEVELIR